MYILKEPGEALCEIKWNWLLDRIQSSPWKNLIQKLFILIGLSILYEDRNLTQAQDDKKK